MPTVAIIGASIGGLYVADALAREHGMEVHMFDKAHRVGGRVHTVRNTEMDSVAYEGGPWRISTEHHRMLALIERIGLTVNPIKCIPAQQRLAAQTHAPVAGVTQADVAMLSGATPLDVQRADLQSGYAGFVHTSAADNVYNINTGGKRYVYVKEGWQTLCNKMAASLATEDSSKNGSRDLGTESVVRVLL